MAITKKHQRQRRKKYNKIKQLTRVADHILKDKVICYLDRLSGCVVVDLKYHRVIPPDSREGVQVIAALSRPHKWSCFIAAFGRNQFDEYFKSEQIFAPAKYFQEDLSGIFEEYHSKLIKTVPEHHLCGVGWIADPMGREFTEKEAGTIFTQLEAWS